MIDEDEEEEFMPLTVFDQPIVKKSKPKKTQKIKAKKRKSKIL